jgi:FKBP-type peptidyl-prolyl cis-trans isomerase
MKNALCIIALVGFSTFEYSCNAKPENAAKPKLQTYQEKYSYMIGVDMGRTLKDLNTEIDRNALLLGIEDALQSRPLLLADTQIVRVRKELVQELQNKRKVSLKESGEKNLKEGTAFLDENRTKAGVFSTPSGLQYMILKKGSGPRPKLTDKVMLLYRGMRIDGTVYDKVFGDNQSVQQFLVSDVIPGWREALQLMNVGSKYKIFTPPHLAYGETGMGTEIGPSATLIFELELVSIDK